MKSVVKAIVLVPVAIAAVFLAIANRHLVTVSFDPFVTESPELAITAPLFLVMLLAVMVGVLVGGVASWFVQGKHRKAARRATAEADRLRGETERLKTQVSQSFAPHSR